MYELWTALEQAREYKWVELSHPLDNDSPYWAGIPDGSVELSKMVYDWGNPMLDCLIQTFKFPGQFGTHIDFPGHFLKGGLLSEAYGARQLVYPLCVVDVSEKVKEDVHYAVTVQDILDYEAKYGPIPDGAFVALRTDWGKRWPSMDALSNFDAEGGEHTPGWSMEALKYIYETRSAAANGHETIDTDASQLAAEAGDLACERYVLSSGKLQVELLCNLDQVAPAGAVILVSYPNIKGATGPPAGGGPFPQKKKFSLPNDKRPPGLPAAIPSSSVFPISLKSASARPGPGGSPSQTFPDKTPPSC